MNFSYFVDKLSSDRVKVVTDTIVKLQEFVKSVHRLELDATEFAYMKAMALFSPGKVARIHSHPLSSYLPPHPLDFFLIVLRQPSYIWSLEIVIGWVQNFFPVFFLM